MPYLATFLITPLLEVPAMSVELFRYRGVRVGGFERKNSGQRRFHFGSLLRHLVFAIPVLPVSPVLAPNS